MVERDVIIRIFTNLDEYLRDLEELKKSSTLQDFVTNKITRRYAERTLQLAVEACLDLAQHIISYQGFREPIDNKDCLQIRCSDHGQPQNGAYFLSRKMRTNGEKFKREFRMKAKKQYYINNIFNGGVIDLTAKII